MLAQSYTIPSSLPAHKTTTLHVSQLELPMSLFILISLILWKTPLVFHIIPLLENNMTSYEVHPRSNCKKQLKENGYF